MQRALVLLVDKLFEFVLREVGKRTPPRPPPPNNMYPKMSNSEVASARATFLSVLPLLTLEGAGRTRYPLLAESQSC